MDRRDFLKSTLAAVVVGRPRDTPPSMISGLPQLRTNIGGNCDANGNLTLPIRPSASWYAVFTLVAQVTSGAPQWVLTGEGAPYGFGGGGKITIGAIYSNPGEILTLTITGAAPNAVVSGAIYGFLGQGPEDLPAFVIAGTGGGASGGGALPGGQAIAKATLPAAGGPLTIVVVPCGGSSTVGVYWDPTVGMSATTLLNIEGTVNDLQWDTLPVLAEATNATYSAWLSGANLIPQLFGGNCHLLVPAAGLSQIRLTWLPGAGQAQTVPVTLRATPGGTLPLPIGQRPAANSQPVVIASDQTAVPVSFAATQKPLAYQNRVAFAATVTQVASVAAEAMLTLVPVRAGVAGGGVTTIPVTAGKVLRITQMTVNYRNNAAAVHFTRFTLRTNPSGAAVVASPALEVAEAFAGAALALVGQPVPIPFPDGLEFSGTDQIGVSHLGDTGAVGFSSVALTGFEYTP